MIKSGLPAIHPGEFLREILEDRETSQAQFARAVGVSPMRISHVVKGTRPVTAELALLFGRALGQSPQYWLNLQASYDLKLAERLIEWDPNKAAANFREHGVPFAEAATVLTDDYALTREDPDAIGEQRFVSLGMSATGALLVVYTHPELDVYRIISSWKASKPQRKQYEKSRR